jgi:hypothetical protein
MKVCGVKFVGARDEGRLFRRVTAHDIDDAREAELNRNDRATRRVCIPKQPRQLKDGVVKRSQFFTEVARPERFERPTLRFVV